MSVRILVADDHGVVRRGLRALLESRRGWKICGEAANGRDAVERARRLKPDVAILDIGMPGLNGVEATRQIRKVSPKTEILILSAHGSEKLALEVLEAGARGYVVKEEADESLMVAVEALLRHVPFLTARIAKLMAREKRGGHRKAPKGRLTSREREIVQLLAEGKANKEVAGVLGISAKTVETHRANIMLKLNIHSITDLVHYAIRNKMIVTNE
jgi:DNA-binding NarL/FixJ family response regulator